MKYRFRRPSLDIALFALLASLVVRSALAESPEPAKVRITTWNLQWFPNGSAQYRSVFEGIPFEQRITHPGSHGFPDATLIICSVKTCGSESQ